ncbi:MAG: CRISPR system precrRNA processing endoribonuclease RAMP protein Cas6 [Candidatus Odinarchaeota archaeon]
MLGEFTFSLFVENEGWVPSYYGYLFRAAILQKISEVNPDLASYLHESNLMRPYSLGRPHVESRKRWIYRDRKLLLKEGMMIKYPLRTLNRQVTREMVKSVTLFKDLTIKLVDVSCTIGTVKFETEKRPVVGDMSPARVTFTGPIKFRTPVAFTVKKSPHRSLWADPFTMVKNLLNVYRATAGEDRDTGEIGAAVFNENDFLDELEIHGYVRIVKGWASREVPLGKERKIIGAVGELEWKFDGKFPPDYLETMKKLLLFGSFSNTGSSRTVGMGVFDYK